MTIFVQYFKKKMTQIPAVFGFTHDSSAVMSL